MLWYGAQDVLTGEMTGGRLSQFVLYAVFGAGALGELSQVWSEVSAAAGAAGRIAEILSVEPAIKAPGNPRALPSRRSALWRSAMSTSPIRAERTADVLHGLDLDVARRRARGHRGAIGRGQEHHRAAHPALLRSHAGRVLVDGVPAREVDPAGVAPAHRIRAAGSGRVRHDRSREHRVWPAGRQPTPS